MERSDDDFVELVGGPLDGAIMPGFQGYWPALICITFNQRPVTYQWDEECQVYMLYNRKRWAPNGRTEES